MVETGVKESKEGEEPKMVWWADEIDKEGLFFLRTMVESGDEEGKMKPVKLIDLGFVGRVMRLDKDNVWSDEGEDVVLTRVCRKEKIGLYSSKSLKSDGVKSYLLPEWGNRLFADWEQLKLLLRSGGWDGDMDDEKVGDNGRDSVLDIVQALTDEKTRLAGKLRYKQGHDGRRSKSLGLSKYDEIDI